MTPVRDFHVDVEQDVLDDLQRRLVAKRWPDEAPGSDWRLGTWLPYQHDLVEYWRTGFD